MKVYLTLDPGSCHMRFKGYAHELINAATECGADAIKFQLGVKSPNIDLPLEWWPELVDHAKRNKIDIYASTFSEEAFQYYVGNHLALGGKGFIKFAYSQNDLLDRMEAARTVGFRVLASGDFMKRPPKETVSVSYYCVPEYPLMWQPNFERVFDTFDGFSDHSIGRSITIEALRNMSLVSTPQPWYLEKHLTLDRSDIDCPDNNFAMRPYDVKKLIDKMKIVGWR